MPTQRDFQWQTEQQQQQQKQNQKQEHKSSSSLEKVRRQHNMRALSALIKWQMKLRNAGPLSLKYHCGSHEMGARLPAPLATSSDISGNRKSPTWLTRTGRWAKNTGPHGQNQLNNNKA
ncbi:GD24505 [Drosophila simulans]|uniref:GD24505 n=1 Tax=Drosophila simulans TaxID=7240 RepID=B4NUG1_DROSI|nr:GD24505 [Drosophila simulans]